MMAKQRTVAIYVLCPAAREWVFDRWAREYDCVKTAKESLRASHRFGILRPPSDGKAPSTMPMDDPLCDPDFFTEYDERGRRFHR